MEHLTNWQILGFLLVAFGFIIGIIDLVFSKKRINTGWFYFGALTMVAGLAIVLISVILTAPANHAGVGFFSKKIIAPPGGKRDVSTITAHRTEQRL